MDMETCGKIDRWIGPSLCLASTGLRHLADALTPSADASLTQPPKRILFLKLTEMGATVLAYQAFRRAEDMVGRENVFLLTLQENRQLSELIGLLPSENILTVSLKSPWTFTRDMLQRLAQIRRARIDVVIDLEFFMRATALLAWMSGARRRVGLHRFNWEAPYRGDLFTHKMHYNPHVHTTWFYDAMVRAASEKAGDCPAGKFSVPVTTADAPRYVPTEDERERLRDRLVQMAGAPLEGPIVLLNPNCGDVLPVRRWPTAHYIALAREILERYESATIFCVGLACDRDAVAEICKAVDPARMHSLAGETTFRELLTLFTVADVLVSADSGPPHFAAMTDIATVVLFGPETPNLFGPIGNNSRVLTANFACSPCVTPLNQRIPPCRENACMTAISVETVLDAVQQSLASRARAFHRSVTPV